MAYEKTSWDIATPLNATNLNKIEEGIYQAYQKFEEIGILNEESESSTYAYSCDYINKNFLVKYSEEEFLTNEYIGDKRVCGKRFIITDTISNDATIPLNVENFDDLWIDMSNSYFKATNNYIYPLPIVLYSGEQDRVCPFIFENKLKFHCDTAWGETWTKVITIKYTKL